MNPFIVVFISILASTALADVTTGSISVETGVPACASCRKPSASITITGDAAASLYAQMTAVKDVNGLKAGNALTCGKATDGRVTCVNFLYENGDLADPENQ